MPKHTGRRAARRVQYGEREKEGRAGWLAGSRACAVSSPHATSIKTRVFALARCAEGASECMHVYLKCASQAKISKIIFNGKRGGGARSLLRALTSAAERLSLSLSALSSKSVCLKETLG